MRLSGRATIATKASGSGAGKGGYGPHRQVDPAHAVVVTAVIGLGDVEVLRVYGEAPRVEQRRDGRAAVATEGPRPAPGVISLWPGCSFIPPLSFQMESHRPVQFPGRL